MPTTISNDLNISEAGMVTFDGVATFHGRTLIGTGGISITNGSGVAGNPTISFTGSDTNPPIGALQYFSLGGTDTTYPDPNWLPADGSIVSQATYATLFSRLGLINGGGTLWTRQNPISADTVLSIAYGNSTYVYGTSRGRIFNSANGNSWNLQVSGTTSQINGLTYGTVFVFVTSGGGLSTSTDGVTWTARTSGTSSNIQAITYQSGTYVYTAAGVTASSTDAITWTARKLPIIESVPGGLGYGNGIFVTGGQFGIVTSTDGTTWDTKLPLIGPNTATVGNNSLIYANAQYVSAGINGTLCTSTDAVRWIARVTASTSTFNALVFGTAYVAGGQGGLIESSTDAITWTARTSNTTSSVLALAFGNSTHVYGTAVGGGGTSADGTTWVAHNSGSASNINSITYGTVFAYGLNGGGAFTSTDGVTFTARTSNTASNIYSMIYGNSLYVYSGAVGALGTSTDAITWTARTSGTSSSIFAMTYGTVYVYGGSGGVLATSTDAITWTQRNSATSSTIYSLIYQGGTYYAAGSGANIGYICTSTDAITWNRVVQNPNVNAISALTYGAKFIAGGQSGLLISSTDAMTWTSLGVNATASLGTVTGTISALIYANSTYFGVGTGLAQGSPYGLIISSTDGATWFQVKNTSITNLSSLVYGTQYVAAGSNGETVTSSATYSYNSVTNFQLPTDNNNIITDEVGNNFKRKLYIKAL